MKKRRFKPRIPAVIVGNVTSLANKMDELVPVAMEALRGAVETAGWNALYELHIEDIDGTVDCVSEYIRFCMDNTTKVSSCYPNKP